MPARKNRPGKSGIGTLDSHERQMLHYWFGEHRNTDVWIDPEDIVFGVHGFDTGKGGLVRGLVTKGYLARQEVRSDLDWAQGATVRYVLTPKGRQEVPNAKDLDDVPWEVRG